jgi:magnesium-transporting ATPase (P-type)
MATRVHLNNKKLLKKKRKRKKKKKKEKGTGWPRPPQRPGVASRDFNRFSITTIMVMSVNAFVFYLWFSKTPRTNTNINNSKLKTLLNTQLFL